MMRIPEFLTQEYVIKQRDTQKKIANMVTILTVLGCIVAIVSIIRNG